MRVLDICSGIGGMSLGLERAGMKTVAFCEIDPFCRKILKKHWPDVPVFEDLKELANEPRGTIPEFDIIAGGVPCQPFSVAGKQEGQQDDRHLWPFMFEIIKQQEPAFVLVENVAGFVNMALDDVLSDLESEGYASQSYLIPACSVDAPHRRERCWVISKFLGYSEHDGFSTSSLTGSYDETPGPSKTKGTEEARESKGTSGRKDDVIVPDSNSHDGRRGSGTKSQGRESRLEHGSRRSGLTERQPNQTLADSKGERMERHWTSGVEESQASSGSRLPRRNSARGEPAVWPPEPRVGRVAHGVPNRVDRIRGLGNAVVVPLVEVLGHAIMEEYYGP